MSNSNNLQEFKEYELYPALFEMIDRAFPDMRFTRTASGKWISPLHLDGSKSSSKDQTFIAPAKKHLIHDQSGETLSLIDFEMRRTGADFITAMSLLADVCSLTLPNTDTEEYKAYLQSQEDKETANKRFTSALWGATPEATEVLSYLRSRQWTDEEIKKAELGYIDEVLRDSLNDRGKYSFALNGDAIGVSHRLTIPYRNGSRLFGFKFRNIHYGEEEKAQGRVKYLNSKGLSKGAGLFGMGIGYKDVTVVEGELDALHAKVKGIPNVVATTGNGVSEEQAREAIRRGVKRFTLLFDNDERGKSFIASSIDVLQRLNASVFVSSLPDGAKDTDEYLGFHTIAEWKGVVDSNSIPVCLWKYNETLTKYHDLCQTQGGTLNFKQREDFFNEVETIANASYTLPQDRQLVFNALKGNEADLQFNADEFKAYIDRAYLRKQDRQREIDTFNASEQIAGLLKERKVDEALQVMKETTAKQGSRDKATEFASIFSPATPQDYAKLLSEVQDGIPTGILFEQGSQREELTLNAGLTFICAYRGHGKTTFLNNIALNEVERNIKLGNDNRVLYFSYEVDKKRLIADLLNTYVNDTLISRNPLNSILSYFKGKRYEMFADYKHGGRKREDGFTTIAHFETCKDNFFKDYLSSGRLTIVGENYKVGKLLDAIKYYVSSHPVSLVCIDYAQLLYSEDYTRQRTEEIKAVVNDIKDFANKEGIPFVLACQFNREVESPVSVDTKNIGEGGDFERIADTCIGLFNLKELHPLPKNTAEDKEAKKLLQDLNVCTYGKDESLKPIPGKMFVRLLKRRYGYYPLDIVLDWEGGTKKITPNAPELLKVEAKQTSLELDYFPSTEMGEELPF